MAHQVGAYLGGIRGVAGLRERCTVDEVTGCWLWQMSLCEGRTRVWLSEHVPGVKRSARLTGPRAAFILRHGHPPPAGHLAYMRCLGITCVNPEHVVAWTREEHGEFVSRIGVWKGDPHRAAASRRNKRKNAKLSIEIAREIRASTETQSVQALRHNVPQSTIGYVRNGRLWREEAPAVPVVRSVVADGFAYCSRAGAVGVALTTRDAYTQLLKQEAAA